jgi:hypothetical protein
VDTIGEVLEVDETETKVEEADAGSEVTRLTEEGILDESVEELTEEQKLEQQAKELAAAAGSEEDFTAAGDEAVHVVDTDLVEAEVESTGEEE